MHFPQKNVNDVPTPHMHRSFSYRSPLLSRKYLHSHISEMVLYIRQIARKCYKITYSGMGTAILKTAKQRLRTPLTCCQQPLRYSHLQWTVSQHSSEISCYNSASGCADLHTLNVLFAVM